MVCGILKDDLIVRASPVKYEDLLKLPHTRKFDITGKPMRGWAMVSYAGYESDDDLFEWVAQGLIYASSLPFKVYAKKNGCNNTQNQSLHSLLENL